MNVKNAEAIAKIITPITLYGGLHVLEGVFLAELVEILPPHSKIVEVGSLAGRSSCALCYFAKDKDVYCVDTWDVQHVKDKNLIKIFGETDVLGIFKKNMKANGYNPHIMKMESVQASNNFADESVDMVFIDADHVYESVKEDIVAWWPKVKKGGLICGHDYNGQEKGVIKAVDEMFTRERIKLKYSIWSCKKE
jgi:predicted O-methyltransferase YrrM